MLEERRGRRPLHRRRCTGGHLQGPAQALEAPIPGGGTVRDLGARVLDIASAGLSARANLDAGGTNETGFLDPLRDVIATGITPADRLLAWYNGPWAGDVSKVYDELSF